MNEELQIVHIFKVIQNQKLSKTEKKKKLTPSTIIVAENNT